MLLTRCISLHCFSVLRARCAPSIGLLLAPSPVTPRLHTLAPFSSAFACASHPQPFSSLFSRPSTVWARSASSGSSEGNRTNSSEDRMPVLEQQVSQENVPAGPPAKVQRMEPVEALRVRRLNADAVLPVRGSAGAAGYDLASCEDTVVPARGKAIVKTGLQIAIPSGTYARVAPRSGLAVKHFIDTGAGVVDEDYRGEVGVVLFNHSDADFPVKKGDRVAQLILERILTPDVMEVKSLDDTARGAGGFGSTGVSGAVPKQ